MIHTQIKLPFEKLSAYEKIIWIHTIFAGDTSDIMVWFNGISTIVGYLMPNPVYTYIINIYDL